MMAMVRPATMMIVIITMVGPATMMIAIMTGTIVTTSRNGNGNQGHGNC